MQFHKLLPSKNTCGFPLNRQHLDWKFSYISPLVAWHLLLSLRLRHLQGWKKWQYFCCRLLPYLAEWNTNTALRRCCLDKYTVCLFRSKFMAATGHNFINKFQRKPYLLNMEEKLA